jgi:hypothetical protein
VAARTAVIAAGNLDAVGKLIEPFAGFGITFPQFANFDSAINSTNLGPK